MRGAGCRRASPAIPRRCCDSSTPSGLRYDITTDLLIAGVRTFPLARYSGVLYRGRPRFSPLQVQRQLRTYVRSGGRLAWLGRHGFEWSVAAGSRARVRRADGTGAPAPDPVRRARRPASRSRRRWPCSPTARTSSPAPADCSARSARIEESLALPRGTRVLAAAGTDADRPAVIVYRSGSGVVARIGVDGFGRALATSPAAERIMRRLWVLLSR